MFTLQRLGGENDAAIGQPKRAGAADSGPAKRSRKL
jgi:hypothetical protein